MWEVIKRWLTLPFGMPGPIELAEIPVLGTLVGLIAIAIKSPSWNPMLTIANWLSNSDIPFLRCEILHKLNLVFVNPGKWLSHEHLGALMTSGHFDHLSAGDLCMQEAGFTHRQVAWINSMSTGNKELYRQRIVAAIRASQPLQFGYRKVMSGGTYMLENRMGKVTLYSET